MTRSARVTELLEAAVAIVAADGLRGLTHRAVDSRAGVPPGSTSYYFRTRQALLQGLAELIAEHEQRDIEQAEVSPELADAPMLRQAADLVAGVLVHWLGPARQRTRARLEIWLLAAERPEMREALGRVREHFLERSRLLLAGTGSAAPAENAQLVVAMIEGLTYDGVTRPVPEPPDRPTLRRVVEKILLAAAE
ncbi:TetR/AcrR family transcriptional regulator [Nonomuraea sp. NPDC059194]|uniref:TetR/AcrR family transcriptional regulator n=1 Tax=Nonomuraea sp. NPDC059194 TaxID=3346764 RepID=UPI0036CFD47A